MIYIIIIYIRIRKLEIALHKYAENIESLQKYRENFESKLIYMCWIIFQFKGLQKKLEKINFML